MTIKELYEILEKANLDFDVIEIFEGSIWLKIDIEDEESENYCVDSQD
jgi:hypothetical protein